MIVSRERFVHLSRGDDLPAGAMVTIEGHGLTTKGELLRALASALDFPDYFGENWDAFEECLRGVDRSVAGTPAVVEITAADVVRDRLPREVGLLQEIWGDAGQDAVTPHLVLA